MNDFSNAAEALAEIERTQQQAYAGQRLPIWYVPGVVGLGTVASIAAEVDGTAQIVLTVVAVAGITSVFVVWGVVPLAVGVFTDSAGWQKAVAGAVTAGYAAATTRWAENLVLARLAGKVAR